MASIYYLVERGILDSELKVIDKKRLNIVKSGVCMQPKTSSGYPYDVITSWLQKSIRRGWYNEAVYAAYQMIHLDEISNRNSMFRSHLLNRLIVILSEDIGLADNVIKFIYRRYMSLRHATLEPQVLARTVCEMIYVLCNCKKSRYICISDRDISYDKSCLNLDIEEVRLLYKLSKKRGEVYGRINYIHAYYLSNPICEIVPEKKYPLDGFVFSYRVWNKNNCTRPVLDIAVDNHTKWGKIKLGRGPEYFLRHGSVVSNYTPVANEIEIVNSKQEAYVQKRVKKTRRDYQAKIIDTITEQIEDNEKVLMNMATGTGKTCTSFWVYDKITRGNTDMIVFPTLDLMLQCSMEWYKMIVETNKTCMFGFLSSRKPNMKRSTTFNYEKLITRKNINDFISLERDMKIIFTTYRSLLLKNEYLKPVIDIAIYDEAHHLYDKNMIGHKKILLTATPTQHNIKNALVVNYTIKDAIEDGNLCDFEIKILPEMDSVEEYMEEIRKLSKKTIMYSLYNQRCRNYYTDLMEKGYENIFQIDCMSNDREGILQRFRNSNDGFMINNRIMKEGVDIPDCDSVFIERGSNSLRSLMQVIGRCTRKHPTKKKSIVYLVNDYKIYMRYAQLKKVGMLSKIMKD